MSPRSEEQNQKIKDERREQILQAAHQVFARKGLTGVKMTEVAAAAGLSQGLVYHYFPDKEALLSAVVERAMQRPGRIIAQALEQPGTPWDRIRWMCEHALASAQSNPEHNLIAFQALASETMREPARKFLQQHYQENFRKIMRLITEGQAAGQVVAGNPIELTLAYLAAIQGVAVIGLHSGDVLKMAPSADTILRLLKA